MSILIQYAFEFLICFEIFVSKNIWTMWVFRLLALRIFLIHSISYKTFISGRLLYPYGYNIVHRIVFMICVYACALQSFFKSQTKQKLLGEIKPSFSTRTLFVNMFKLRGIVSNHTCEGRRSRRYVLQQWSKDNQLSAEEKETRWISFAMKPLWILRSSHHLRGTNQRRNFLHNIPRCSWDKI